MAQTYQRSEKVLQQNLARALLLTPEQGKRDTVFVVSSAGAVFQQDTTDKAFPHMRMILLYQPSGTASSGSKTHLQKLPCSPSPRVEIQQ
ncbi:hypothetical protein [Spirosoma sp. KUDC1026]|uniref:hypothetical protein n=1 Tax=Spirosoma sp. KUDC1026 TaxID=2745947 RepID=UPI00159BD8AA|nr:hypothetical protein [Spirosoma sp. KUDC1026]QKZ14874.1 hypothetical protein HU175_20490 [Spirosoma sp. KUDC1026]